MNYELYEKILSDYYNSEDSLLQYDVHDLDDFFFIKLKKFQFVEEITGELNDVYIKDLLSRVMKGNNISIKEYSLKSLEFKRIYQKFSLELYFSDKFEVDLATFLLLLGRYYRLANQNDKAWEYLAESLKIYQINGVKNELLIEIYQLMAYLSYSKSNFTNTLDYQQSEFINRLIVLPSKKILEPVNDFIINFVNKSISLRNLWSHKRSSSNSLYAYSLLLMRLEEKGINAQNKVEYQNQLIRAMFNYSISLIYQGVPLDSVLPNLEYTFQFINNNNTLDLTHFLFYFDLKFRCLLSLGRDLENDKTVFNELMIKKYKTNFETMLLEVTIDKNTEHFLLLSNINLLTKEKVSIDVAFTNELRKVENNFRYLYETYIITLLLIDNDDELIDNLDYFQELCETQSFYDTAYVLAIILYKFTREIKYKTKVTELKRYKFRFDETLDYQSDSRETNILMKDFLWKIILNYRVILENLFDYKLSSEFRKAEYGSFKYELKPEDIDDTSIHKFTHKKS